MTKRDLNALMERHREAWRRHDPAAIAACHHPDAVIVSPMFATARGRPAILSLYSALFATFPDLEVTVDATVIEPPHAASFETIRGTHTNEFFGYPGTNKPFEMTLARFMTVEGGFITHQRAVYDFTGLLVQIGVLRAKPGKP